MIKIYTTNSCPWCIKTKNFLKSQNLDYEELDVENNIQAREEMISKSHQMSIPVLDINGTIIIGFDKTSILESLNR